MNVPALAKFELLIVRQYIGLLNFFLKVTEKVLFASPPKAPLNILVFKVGNIGDIVCAIPSFIAIRKTYPKARIVLLTSPGDRSIAGAADFLEGAWYFDEMKVYDSKDINSWGKRLSLARELKKDGYDLFIHLPAHDWTTFLTMLRNMIFAKLSGVQSAYGFRIRTVINLFRKTQIDYSFGEKEVESLLRILKNKAVKSEKAEFDFPISKEIKEKVHQFIENKWRDNRDLLIALHPGSKRKYKQWDPEKFGSVAAYLKERYGARFIILGGKDDIGDVQVISKYIPKESVLIAAGQFNVKESIVLTQYCDFFLGVDTGFMHIAAAIGKPVVALFCILNIFGKWFPYGEGHECLYKRFLNCDYKNPKCIKQSIEMITVDETRIACDRVIARLKLDKQ